MNDITTGDFWKATAIRALWTFAQTFLAMMGASGANIFDASVVQILITSLTAAVLSIMKSFVAGVPEVEEPA